MPADITLKIDGKHATLTGTAGGSAVVYHVTVTKKPAGPVVYTRTYTSTAGAPSSTSHDFPDGSYHLHVTGSDGSLYEWDAVIPATPPATSDILGTAAARAAAPRPIHRS